jgi:histidinol-phosphate phosphatase family protein
MNLNAYNFDPSWILFLDRDGVINKRLIDDYVKTWDGFEFLPGVPEALAKFAKIFGRIFIVTNQQGVGKGLMKEGDVKCIHKKMLEEIENAGGRIDAVYFCAALASENSPNRKPNPGMALQAKKDFPEIDFQRSIMAGDSLSDMLFGQNIGALNIFINSENIPIPEGFLAEFVFGSLGEMAERM